MSKIKDVSNESVGIIQLINKDNLFKEVRIYKYKDCKILYCITNYGALHISASTPHGPAGMKDLTCIFGKLTNKSIDDFRFMKTNGVSYLIEEKHPNLN